MMWIDVQQLSPLLGPVRHLAGQRWQRYDGLGIVIQDACHLFTSQPSLISHHRPTHLQPYPPPNCQTRYTRQHHTLQLLFFLPPSLLPLPLSCIPGLNTVRTFNALIYVLCSPISLGLERCLLLSTSTPENWLGFIQTSHWGREAGGGGSGPTCIHLFQQWSF